MDASTKELSYMVATSQGRVYVDKGAFLKDKDVQNTIEKLMDSSIYKSIEARKQIEALKENNKRQL